MIRLIINTIKLLLKKKSYMIISIIIPAFVIVFFSFEFKGENIYKVGIIDNDNTYASKEIISAIDEMEDIQTINIKEEDHEILMITQQIQLAIIIDDNFQDNLLNIKESKIKIKSINESDIKSVVQTMIDLRCEDLSMIANISSNDINEFKRINQEYKDTVTGLSLNDVNHQRVNIQNSLGLIIFLIFIVSNNIANFFIEDEENKTKGRIFNSGIKKWKYYISLVFVFYMMSTITTLTYYIIAKILNMDFGMENSMNFLVVMLLLNLVALSFNLCIVSFTRSRYTSSILNVLIIVPCCMISGVFWNFNVMDENIQQIGRFMPTRWVYVCMENLQQTNNLSNISLYLNSMIILSVILFIMSFIKLKINREI